jgi:hypothetical protein
MPRYVILEHDWPSRHFDLMLEAGPVLRTWRLAALPADGVAVAAEPIGDHRLEYLNYEGPVSGGRGTVRCVQSGDFQWVDESANRIEVDLTIAWLTLARRPEGWVAAVKCI